MARTLSIGCTGTDVRDVQLSLNKRPPTALPLLTADGIFGPKTAARVKEFQKNRGLVVDGIVGPKTLAALAYIQPPVEIKRGCNCGNCEDSVASQAGAIAALLSPGQAAGFKPTAHSNVLGFAGGGGGGGTVSALTSGPIRKLTSAQEATAIGVYGSSLDFSTIFITDKTGLGNRPFTVAIPVEQTFIQVMNCGTFSPSNSTLIHELAHVWQSQHHSNKLRFMVNAVDSQGRAVAANLAAAIDDPLLALNKDFPTFYPYDAYAYNPSQAFSTMAAEQMANAIENGETAVVSHIKGISKNALDPSLVTALANPGYADRRLPGIK